MFEIYLIYYNMQNSQVEIEEKCIYQVLYIRDGHVEGANVCDCKLKYLTL